MMKKYVIMLAAIMLVLQAGCVSRQNSTAESTNLPAQEQSDDVSYDNFNNIIAVSRFDTKNKKWEDYYITKTGKIVGRDSVYSFDNIIAFECSGFIHFRDPKSEKVGLFDKNGNVTIPAEYNALEKIRNGMISALKGARKEYSGEHYFWVGGKSLLIDTLNNILIEDFFISDNGIYMLDFMDFFSVEKTEAPHPDTTRVSFSAKGGGYYSFVVVEREFKQWLLNDLLLNLTPEKLIAASHDTIEWRYKNYIGKSSKQEFIANNFKSMEKELLQILNPLGKGDSISIWGDVLYPSNDDFISYDKNLPLYHTCYHENPSLMEIFFKYDIKGGSVYKFLRTDSGYKLIGIYRR
jgi:hypothetical protein